MKNRLLQALGRLSSENYQEKYIVHGNIDEYVLPEDLVEDVATLIELSRQDEYRHTLTDVEISELDELFVTIQKHGKRLFGQPLVSITAYSLIHENEDWLAIRAKAINCLKSFGYEVEKFSPEEIDLNIWENNHKDGVR
jgi:hypothetical protein